jgi:nucleoid-associated protein YgaU
MKKIVLGIVLAVSLMLVFACKSQPAAAAAGSAPEPTTEEAFKNVYDRYQSKLILDGAEVYTVVSGDTLVRISRNKYHDGFYYPVIMLASSEVVLDPDKIEPGMQLEIPDLQRNLNDPGAKSNIKSFLNEIAVIEDTRERHGTAEGLRKLADTL